MMPATGTGQPLISRDRRRRIPAEDVRAKMLETGRDLAMEVGVGISLEELSLEEVIQRARVPRSSVYRLWPYKGDFVDELLCYLAGPGGYFGSADAFDPSTANLVRKIIASHRHLLASASGRRAVLHEVVRQGVGQNFDAFSANPQWRIHMALLAAVGSASVTHTRAMLAVALENGAAAYRRAIADLIEEVMAALGLRLRNPAQTTEHLAAAGIALVQGLTLRHILAEAAAQLPGQDGAPPATASEMLLSEPLQGPGLDGQPATWTLAAVAYLALMDSFLEADPDFLPSNADAH